MWRHLTSRLEPGKLPTSTILVKASNFLQIRQKGLILYLRKIA
jgi:hypothetical protein